MAAIHTVKRALREHPYSRQLYFALADQWTRTRIAAYQLFAGRYHSAERFDHLFSGTPDPWGYGKCLLSHERRRLLLEKLPEATYASMLEIGCAEGWITRLLAARTQQLTAIDISEVALARARDRCRDLGNIIYRRVDILEDAVEGRYDAVVCAGVLVYLPLAVQPLLRDRILALLAPGATLLLEHTVVAYPGEISGRDVHDLYRRHPDLELVSHQDIEDYAITVLRKTRA